MPAQLVRLSTMVPTALMALPVVLRIARLLDLLGLTAIATAAPTTKPVAMPEINLERCIIIETSITIVFIVSMEEHRQKYFYILYHTALFLKALRARICRFVAVFCH